MGKFDFLNTPRLDGLDDEDEMLTEGTTALGNGMPNHQFSLPSGVTVSISLPPSCPSLWTGKRVNIPFLFFGESVAC